MTKPTLKRREPSTTVVKWPENVPPVLQRVYESRGVVDPAQVEHRLLHLLSPKSLGSISKAAAILTQAIADDKHITVAGDYDCDGATGSAVAVRGLRMLGAKNVRFIVPNRFTHGYGLSPGLVNAMDPATEVIVTVDSGVSSVEGVNEAKKLGRTVVITDHHLPGEILPLADAIVNPNLNDDDFPSKALAGVGVMFYVLMAIRAHQRELGIWIDTGPDLTTLLDLVALGTVADLVPLDFNNRIIVSAGLRRIRAGKSCPGIQELIAIAGKDPTRLIASDIGFTVAPRLNAAGRLENMTVGVEALITDDPNVAKALVAQLDAINKDRREIQATMVAEAVKMVDEMRDLTFAVGVTVYDPSWHAGVVGLVASKLKENLHQPTFAFASGGEGSDEVRGSGRSIEGFHLRDALAAVDAKHPGMILKFGGHAMAAGLSLKTVDINRFAIAFDEVATATLTDEQLQALVVSDGELLPGEITLDTARLLRENGPWGQGFPAPVFDNVFHCIDWRLMGQNHLKFLLKDPRDDTLVEAVMFGGFTGEPPPVHMRAAYEMDVNTWNDRSSLQLMVRHIDTI